jgi:sarcosine oxidase subunit gamma
MEHPQMAEAYNRRSALQHFGLTAAAAHSNQATAGVVIGESPHRAIVNVRGEGTDPAFVAAMRSVTGADLPVKPNTTALSGTCRILWLGPREWWIVTSGGGEEKLVTDLRQAFSGLHAAVTDVSESRTVITLSGPQAHDVLARGCSLDLHPRVFGAGQCAQTGLAKANVLICQIESTPMFEIFVLKSFADYVWQWFGLVARDFDLAIRAG